MKANSRQPEVDKRTAQIVAHVSEETAARFRAMAELDKTTASEKSGELITEYLEFKQAQFEGMKRVFGNKQNCE